MRTIGVVTTSRADYGIYSPILRKARETTELKLELLVTGMHLSPEFGSTVRIIEEDGFEIAERVEMLLSSDTPGGIAKSMAAGTAGFAQFFSRNRPDILLVLGDRFEMHAATVAALPFRIPVAHIHGGEVTTGAIDESFRHSITKMSHIHLVSTEEYRRRVIQLGEEPWRVTVCGAPSLDNISEIDLLSREELETSLGVDLSEPPILVTFHPTTLEHDQIDYHTGELLRALSTLSRPILFTMPNADTGGRSIREGILSFVKATAKAWAFENLGTRSYFSLMQHAAAMVGNSSSGLLEAATFELPVVNIGNRQAGRVRPPNVIDVGYKQEMILKGVEGALDEKFRTGLVGLKNPYRGQGSASEIILKRLSGIELDDRLIMKRFYDMPRPNDD